MPQEPRIAAALNAVQSLRPDEANPQVRDVEVWARQVTDELQEIRPRFSIFSTLNGPNESGISGRRGQIGLETGSSASTTLWVFTSSSSVTGAWGAVI